MLDRFFRLTTNLFPLWSVLVAVVALWWPEAFLWYGKETITIGLGIIMLGMGLTLSLADFRRVWQRPAAIGLGVVLQFAVMPFLGWGIAQLFNLPQGMAVGLILVSCCPGGTASNVVAFLARADVALSVSMTTVSTLAAVALTPLLTKFYADEYVPVDARALLQSIVLIVILPVSVGVVANRLFGGMAQRIATFSPFVSVVFIILIVGFIMADKRDDVMEHWKVLTAAVTLLHGGGFALGYLLAKIIGFEESIRRTASIEVGMQNSGLGAALATKHFTALPMAPVPCVLSAVTHCILGSLFAGFWRVRKGLKSKTDHG
jgi:bile acid:Na+ symporter, BASS family